MYKNDEPIFTPEAQAALKSLEALDRAGWKLADMTTGELEAIEKDIATVRKGRCWAEKEIGSYSSKLTQKAAEALRMERLRRDTERNNAIREQQNRIQIITAAATSLERAAKQMEEAESIEDKRHIIPRYPVDVLTAERVHAMDDVALERLEGMETRQADVDGSVLNEKEHSASVLEKHGGARGKRLAKVLRAVANESREKMEAHRSNAEVARAELDARAERARKMQEAEQSLPTTTATVDDLLARVAELEEKLATAQQ